MVIWIFLLRPVVTMPTDIAATQWIDPAASVVTVVVAANAAEVALETIDVVAAGLVMTDAAAVALAMTDAVEIDVVAAGLAMTDAAEVVSRMIDVEATVSMMTPDSQILFPSSVTDPVWQTSKSATRFISQDGHLKLTKSSLTGWAVAQELKKRSF